MPRRFPTIPHPQKTLDSHHEAIMALKEAIEILTRQRAPGQVAGAAVTWEELVERGVVGDDEVPSQ